MLPEFFHTEREREKEIKRDGGGESTMPWIISILFTASAD
jgi:hypothetical protein